MCSREAALCSSVIVEEPPNTCEWIMAASIGQLAAVLPGCSRPASSAAGGSGLFVASASEQSRTHMTKDLLKGNCGGILTLRSCGGAAIRANSHPEFSREPP